jgi:hypothetical protein
MTAWIRRCWHRSFIQVNFRNRRETVSNGFLFEPNQ